MKLRISRGVMHARLMALSAVLVLLIGGAGAGAQSYTSGLDAVEDGRVEEAVAIWQGLIDADAPDRAQAEYALALLYETGRAVPWDEARAATLYAASGLPEALTNLGLMYAQGRGVDFDPAKAAELWQQAADQGHAFASFNLGLAYYAGDGVPRNAVRALELIYAAGEGGLAEAQWAVCQFYERGVGVAADRGTALDWCQRAAAQGHEQAGLALSRLGQNAASGETGAQEPSASARALSEEPLSEALVAEEFADDLAAGEAALSDEGAPSSNPDDGAADDGAAEATAETAQSDDSGAEEIGPTEIGPEETGPEETNTSAKRDPLLLLGSEFEEFADLLAPVDETEEAQAHETAGPDPKPSEPASPESDAIAALIEAASAVVPELGELDVLAEPDALEARDAPAEAEAEAEAEASSDDPSALSDAPPLPAGRPQPDFTIPAPGAETAFALWLGTGKDLEEARALYDDVLSAAPEILGLLEAAYQNDRLPPSASGTSSAATAGQPIVRLLFGPLPGQAYAWQLCNLLRTKRRGLFCLPVAVEDS